MLTPNDTPDLAAAASHLRDDHINLERRFGELCLLAHDGDWHDLDEVWDGFVHDVEAHFEIEERQLFPRLAEQGRDSRALVAELVADHLAIRQTLEDLGLQIQIHVIRASTIDSFVSQMRKHAARENERVYPWAASTGAGAPAPAPAAY
jgi:hypothetical protein